MRCGKNYPTIIGLSRRLNKEGQLTVLDWKDFSNELILEAPEGLPYGELVKANFLGHEKTTALFGKWSGESCIISKISDARGVLGSIDSFMSYPLRRFYNPLEAQFITSPLEGFPPFNAIYLVTRQGDKDSLSSDTLSKKLVNENLEISASDASQLGGLYFNELIQFEKSYRDIFAYGYSYFNIAHPIVQTIIRSYAKALQLANSNNGLDFEIVGRIQDAVNRIGRNEKQIRIGGILLDAIPYEIFCRDLNNFFSLVKEFKIMDINPEKLVPSPDDFVKGTIRRRNNKFELITYSRYDIIKVPKNQKIPSFGKPIATTVLGL